MKTKVTPYSVDEHLRTPEERLLYEQALREVLAEEHEQDQVRRMANEDYGND